MLDVSELSRLARASFPTADTADTTASFPTGDTADATASVPTGDSADATASVPTGDSADATASVPTGDSADATASFPMGDTTDATASANSDTSDTRKMAVEETLKTLTQKLKLLERRYLLSVTSVLLIEVGWRGLCTGVSARASSAVSTCQTRSTVAQSS